MHSSVLTLATLWIAGLLGVTVIVAIMTRSALTRILALDMLTLILVAFLALSTDAADSAHALDAALILALLSFVATLAAARFYSRGSLFQ
ncbi:MAG: monovalent cation/H+ antiporter complex subunit F [Chloroflexota bacterium]|nr:monovalent cation/H+ antiporter complex subunit F [Chloroflexota bacterium]